MKKKLSTVMAALVAFGCVGAAGCSDTAKTFPMYTDDKVMMIGGWDAPKNTLEDYQFAKDMGLTFMFLDDLFVKRGTQGYADVLGYCEQVGLDVIISVGNSGNTEYAKDSWAADTTDYSQYPAVKAINYWDEPYYGNFDRIEEMATQHIEKYGSNVDFFLNHFPNSAYSAFGGKTYVDFITEYVDRVVMKFNEGHRYLSADIYPLEEKNGESVVRSNWLNCIETIATQGKRAKATTHFFIQTTEHYTYRAVTEEDIRWQFFVNMAFGVQAFSYFTYRDSILSDFKNSCVDDEESCKPHDQYYYAQTVNKEIASFDHVYLSFDWNGTMPVIGTANDEGYNINFDGLSNPLESIDVLNEVSATQDALIGQFKDKDGNDGLIVTNFTDPADGFKNKVSLKFKKANKVRVYTKGQVKDYQISNNTFNLNLGVGEGVFLIPIA